MRRLAAFAFVWVIGIVPPALAGDQPTDEMRSLDERVQAIKGDVLEIAAELTQLEEKLLYPSDTQIAVFISMTGDHQGELDSVDIQIDGAPVARHIYSFKEIEALRKGGIQRIYTGNTTTGDHVVAVTVKSTLPGGRVVDEQKQFTVAKNVGPKLVAIEIASSENGDLRIGLGDG